VTYVRGQAQDYDAWRDAGAQGWGYLDVEPYWIRLLPGEPARRATLECLRRLPQAGVRQRPNLTIVTDAQVLRVDLAG